MGDIGIYDGTDWRIVAADSGWKLLPLLDGWTEYGQGYSPARYRMLGSGMVVVEGLVKSGTSGSVGQLPVGYRPAYNCLLSTSVNPNAFSRLDVTSGGVVAVTGWDATWTSINCSFYAGP